VSVLVPVDVNVIEQLPVPDESDPEQDSPVLALTVTVPVGIAPPAATETPITTAWLRVEGFGVCETIVVVVAAFAAVVFCVFDDGAVKFASAGHEAVTVHVPVELIIFIAALEFAGEPPTDPAVHMPLVPVIDGIVLALVVAVTLKEAP